MKHKLDVNRILQAPSYTNNCGHPIITRATTPTHLVLTLSQLSKFITPYTATPRATTPDITNNFPEPRLTQARTLIQPVRAIAAKDFRRTFTCCIRTPHNISERLGRPGKFRSAGPQGLLRPAADYAISPRASQISPGGLIAAGRSPDGPPKGRA